MLPATDMSAHNVAYTANNNTHPALKLTPDKSEIITLNNDAASIIIGNSKHLNIMTDSSKRLVIIPRAPGASHFTVLGHDGTIVMQRHVIVASPQKDYLRIRRNCAGAGDDCAPTSVYYCPDGCHEVSISEGTEKSTRGNDAGEGPSQAAIAQYLSQNAAPIPPNATPE